jgi:hypothetical protein
MKTTPAALRNSAVLSLAALVLAGLAGCRGGSGPYPVRGTVVWEDGQPATELGGYTVSFESEALHKSATGDIGADATFQLTTVQLGDGAVPGRYKVTITPPPAPAAGERGQKHRQLKPALDRRYQSLEQTDLVAKVEAESNVIQLKVKRAGSAKP